MNKMNWASISKIKSIVGAATEDCGVDAINALVELSSQPAALGSDEIVPCVHWRVTYYDEPQPMAAHGTLLGDDLQAGVKIVEQHIAFWDGLRA